LLVGSNILSVRCEKKAVECNKNKKKTQALTHLRRKKKLQEVLDKRRGSAQTISDILDTIEKTQTDKEVYRGGKGGRGGNTTHYICANDVEFRYLISSNLALKR